MDGNCRLSPHRGHYWVEDIPESDNWACRWCGMTRHFNHERIEKMRLAETVMASGELAPQQWFSQLWDLWSGERRSERSLRLDADTYLHVFSD